MPAGTRVLSGLQELTAAFLLRTGARRGGVSAVAGRWRLGGRLNGPRQVRRSPPPEQARLPVAHARGKGTSAAGEQIRDGSSGTDFLVVGLDKAANAFGESRLPRRFPQSVQRRGRCGKTDSQKAMQLDAGFRWRHRLAPLAHLASGRGKRAWGGNLRRACARDFLVDFEDARH